MRSHERLEIQFAEWNHLDPKGMVACSSGTAALALAMEVVKASAVSFRNDGSHDEVITNDFSMIACPRSINMAGLKPVFVDCNDRLLMEGGAFIDSKSNRSRAVLAVHIYGRKESMNHIHYLSEPRGLLVIEDLAEAHGIKPDKDTFAACWSFYANKIVAGQEGGAIWFRDHKMAGLARHLRCLGFTDAHNFIHIPRGHNYRLADCLADLIIDSIKNVDENLERRRWVEYRYNQLCPPQWKMPEREVPWVYDLRLHGIGTLKQTEIIKKLREAGIEARHAFKPCHRQEEFKNCRMVKDQSRDIYSASELASVEVIYLPCHPKVTGTEINKAFEIIQREMEGVNTLK